MNDGDDVELHALQYSLTVHDWLMRNGHSAKANNVGGYRTWNSRPVPFNHRCGTPSKSPALNYDVLAT